MSEHMNNTAAQVSAEPKLLLSSSPFIKSKSSLPQIMWDVMIAMIPAWIWALMVFGIDTLWVTIVSIGAAVATEMIILKVSKKPIAFVMNGSAFVTGFLIAFNMNAGVPLWIPAIASVFAIAIVKHVFGGLGHNFLNPALAGRVFVYSAWTGPMTGGWTLPKLPAFLHLPAYQEWLGRAMTNASESISSASVETTAKTMLEQTADTFSGATPLGEGIQTVLSGQGVAGPAGSAPSEMYWNLFIGNHPGCLGEVSVLLLLIGFIYLVYRRVIKVPIPLMYLLTVAGMALIFKADPLYHLLAGGLMLGALYMATDMVTTPITLPGMIIFGVGCGILTGIFRMVSKMPEGVQFSILLMNVLVPLLDRYIKPKVFGTKKTRTIKEHNV